MGIESMPQLESFVAQINANLNTQQTYQSAHVSHSFGIYQVRNSWMPTVNAGGGKERMTAHKMQFAQNGTIYH